MQPSDENFEFLLPKNKIYQDAGPGIWALKTKIYQDTGPEIQALNVISRVLKMMDHIPKPVSLPLENIPGLD